MEIAMDLRELMGRNSIFAQFDDGQKIELVDLSIPRRFQKGEWVAYYGDIWPNLFLVGSGRVTAVKESSEGRSLIVVSLQEGEVFWGPAFFLEGTPTPVGLIADEPSLIHTWSRERLLPILLDNGHSSWELACSMIRRMLRASDIVEELAFQPITGRLARLLIEQYGEAGEDPISRDLTLDEMAAHIGTTREMVCRQLYRFADEGVIHINRTEFRIADRERLTSMAGKVKG